MKASVIDLRKKMSQIMKALDRNEDVTILYHGKEKAIIVPIRTEKKLKVTNNPFFGMYNDSEITVEQEMESLRSGRFNDI